MTTTIEKRISAVRKVLKKARLEALLVPTGDPHMSEYLPENWAFRRWLTGFTGSAGTLVVTTEKALLWTDSRYWEQAAKETEATGITVMESGAADVPDVRVWLAENLPENASVGLDCSTVSSERLRLLENTVSHRGISVVDTGNLIDKLWTDRPGRSEAPVRPFTTAQKPAAEKIADVRTELSEHKADALFLSTLDDIAWITNLRGSDVLHTPVFIAYFLLTADRAELFIDTCKVTKESAELFKAAGITVKPYETADAALKALRGTVLCDLKRTNARAAALLTTADDVVVLDRMQPTTVMKSRKTQAELTSLRETMTADGVALCELFAWVAECDETHKDITETDVSDFLHEARAKIPGFFDESFTTIAAYGANAAQPHYTPKAGSAAKLTGESLLLVDSGGQFEGGTTDVTRTVIWGRPTDAMKRDFTAVLRGHIALATARFPLGAYGSQLDTLARAPIWEIGADYGHGTGHGVGFVLSVHEGPVHISPRAPQSPEARVVPGLVLSNEPGLYRPGLWGIRTENLVTPVAADPEADEMQAFLHFETLTLCPIDYRLVKTAMMTPYEIWWVNDYHRRVREVLENRVSPRAHKWLMRATDII